MTETTAGHDRLDTAVDAAAVASLAAIALLGLDPVFDSGRATLVGLLGIVVGIGVALVSAGRRWGPPATLVALVAAFLLAAGPAVPDTALAGVLPGPGTPWAVVRGATTAWRDALTTAPPVPLVGGLGVIPHLLGFGAGAGGMLLARRTRTSLLPAVPALVAAVATWLIGTRTPASVLAQGTGFLVVAVGWAAVRANRDRREPGREIHWPRAGAAVAMLLLVAVLATVIGPRLPHVRDERRVVRDEVVPPFDPRDYPSPLAGFRSHLTEDAKEQVLFRADGLEEGTLVRLAVMDTYDGVVWVVGGDEGGGTGRFERVGRDILPVPDGPAVAPVLTVEDYKGVWVPTVGATRSVRFAGAHADTLRDEFRYNRQTAAGATPVPLVEGDQIALDAVRLPLAEAGDDGRADLDIGAAPVDSTASLPALPPNDVLDTFAAEHEAISDAPTPYARAEAIESVLSEGAYSDGALDGPDVTSVKSPPGHSLYRLTDFVGLEPFVGNDEQYAAAMAYLARRMGLPARVVLGFVPEDPARLTGADVAAWVEIAFQGVGWVPFFPTPDESQRLEEPRETPTREEAITQQPPPQTNYTPPPDPSVELADRRPDTPDPDEALDRFGLPTWLVTVIRYVGPPALVIGGTVALLVGGKALRRRRRRSRGTPVDRVGGAWAEVIDQARDFGRRTPRRATRVEGAAALAATDWPDPTPLAHRVDGLMFGPLEPTDAAAAELWRAVDAHRRAAGRSTGRRRRVVAALNPVSLVGRR